MAVATRAQIKYLQRRARQMGLDPQAVMAVARGEGLSGKIGDGGHAFGPFQMNNAGGVITGRFKGWSAEKINQWAWSKQGIDTALRGLASVAKGMSGEKAIKNIITRYERPADIPGSIANALERFRAGPAGAGATGGSGGGAPARMGTQFNRQAFAEQAGAIMMQTARETAGGDLRATAGIPDALTAAREAATTRIMRAAAGGGGRGGGGDPGKLEAGGGWGGSKGIADVFKGIGLNSGLSIMSEKRDTKATSSGGVSDHWVGSKTGYAYDLSNGSSPTPQMDRAALRIARKMGNKSYKLGQPLVYTVTRNGYRMQVLYRTQVGGNHNNHVHVGVRKA